MSFTNLYYKRAVATARPCYICYKPTTTVLATIQTIDFIYVCDSHLSDPGFASQVGEAKDGIGAGGAKMGLSPDEIARVKQEWEERQKKKQGEEKEKGKEKEKEKEEKENDKDKASSDNGDKGEKKTETGSKTSSKPASSPSSGTSTPSPTAKPSHERYTLHRDYFAMRLADHRKRRQAAQTKELAPRLPGAPKAALPAAP